MINLLSLDQLAHKAYCEDNEVALAILNKLDDAIKQAEQATKKNDGYRYEIFDAVKAVEWLAFNAEWYKVEETKWTKDKIIYMIKGFHEDTHPYKNQVELWKYKGRDVWNLEVSAGEYGEDRAEISFEAKGFKDAQEQATKQIIQWIKKGLEINL